MMTAGHCLRVPSNLRHIFGRDKYLRKRCRRSYRAHDERNTQRNEGGNKYQDHALGYDGEAVVIE